MLHGKTRFMDRDLKSRGMQNALVVRISADGELVWARQFGRSWHNQAHHIEPGPDGTVFIAGVAANGFHRSLARLRNPNGWENERPFVAVLDGDGTMIAAKDLTQRVKDLRAYAQGVRVAGEQGLVEELGPNLEDRGRHDYDIERDVRGYPYEMRLDDHGGLWTASFAKSAKPHDFQISRFEPDRAPVHRVLERPTRGISTVQAIVYEHGLIVASAETRELSPSIVYPTRDGGERIVQRGEYERYMHWWSLDDRGDVRWHHEQRLQTAVTPRLYGTPIAMVEHDGTIFTRLATEGPVRVAGRTLSPPSERSVQYGFIVAMDEADGRVTEILEPKTPCGRSWLNVGTGDLLIRNLFMMDGDDIVLSTNGLECHGRSPQVIILSAGAGEGRRRANQ